MSLPPELADLGWAFAPPAEDEQSVEVLVVRDGVFTCVWPDDVLETDERVDPTR